MMSNSYDSPTAPKDERESGKCEPKRKSRSPQYHRQAQPPDGALGVEGTSTLIFYVFSHYHKQAAHR